MDILLTPYHVVTGMSTPVYSEPESVQADGAQDSRVPVSTCTDPYVAVRLQIASSIDSESEPEEAPFEPEDTPMLRSSTPPESGVVILPGQLGVGSVSPTRSIPPAVTTLSSPV